MTKLYDALVRLGRDKSLKPFQYSDVDSLRGMLDKYGIDKALVSAYASRGLEVSYGNELMFEAAERDERLVPCPVVVPNSGLEVGDEDEYIDGLIQRGVRCVCFHPQATGTTLDQRVVGGLFAAIERRRLSVALFETNMLGVASVAEEYPGIPFIVHIPSYRDRTLIPALKSAPNVHVSIMPNLAPYRGLEVLIEQCGAEKFLFASGYPESEPGAAISYLLYSDLDDETVEKVAFGNLARLMDAVSDDGEPEPASDENAERCPQGIAHHVWQRETLPWDGIVDMHAHYGKWAGFPIWGADAGDLVAEMDRVGVEKIFVSHQAVMGTEVVFGNDQVLDGIARYPDRILGYAVCYPLDEALGITEIRRGLDQGLHGIKLHSSSGVPYGAEEYKPVWELADERHLPVLLHTWGDIDKLEPIFEAYPNASILLGHSGSANPEMYVEYARRYPNLYLELCYSKAPYGIVEYFVREVGAERVLWGSDAPWMSIQQQLGRVLFADISDEEKKQILVENPRRILAAVQ